MNTENAKKLARRYAKVVYWSDEDNKYIGSLPEICGPCCDADTEAEVYTLLDEIAYDMVLDKLEGVDMGTIPDPGNLSFIIKTRQNNSANSGSSVAQIRKKLNVSQSVFADMMGVSRFAVLKWEDGSRKPAGPASRLLEIVAKHPELVLQSV